MATTETTAVDLKDRLLADLTGVIDPELGVDLVSLGLIYGLNMQDGVVTVTMTLTTIGCPISQVLQNMIESALEKEPEVAAVNIEIVWSPAWTPDKMSRYARMALRYHY